MQCEQLIAQGLQHPSHPLPGLLNSFSQTSPKRFFASGSLPVLKLRVGSKSNSSMMTGRWPVPITRILFCTLSSSRISPECSLPTFLTASSSAGPFMSMVILFSLHTNALMFLFLKTEPIPPRPACLYRGIFRRMSHQEKFKQPIHACSAAGPDVTTDISLPSFSVCLSLSTRVIS